MLKPAEEDTMRPLVSIIVNNCNYAPYLAQAIDSALDQTYPHAEVIVVDDGSTDESRDIIRSYGSRIAAVLKPRCGQTSAMNTGFEVSRGEIICFLDADDVLLPGAADTVVPLFREEKVVNVYWPLFVIDRSGAMTGRRNPPGRPPEGNLLDFVLYESGPDALGWSPTSGNAWARSFLCHIFPMTELERTLGIGSASADSSLSMLAPVFGLIRRIDEPQGCKRVHAASDYSSRDYETKLEREVALFDHRSDLLQHYCRLRGIDVDPEIWRQRSWRIRLVTAFQEITALVPPRSSFILVDNARLGIARSANYRPVPFLERDGQYWGPPAGDATAIQELERLRREGAAFIVFAWPAFWWLQYYTGFHEYLRSHFPRVLQNERLVAFDLQTLPLLGTSGASR